jgi:hypothetical protein
VTVAPTTSRTMLCAVLLFEFPRGYPKTTCQSKLTLAGRFPYCVAPLARGRIFQTSTVHQGSHFKIGPPNWSVVHLALSSGGEAEMRDQGLVSSPSVMMGKPVVAGAHPRVTREAVQAALAGESVDLRIDPRFE